MWHRPLGEMLEDVFDAVQAARNVFPQMRARAVTLSLPIEVWLQPVNGETTFIADVPIWLWRTVFDQVPSRMHITWEESAL